MLAHAILTGDALKFLIGKMRNFGSCLTLVVDRVFDEPNRT